MPRRYKDRPTQGCLDVVDEHCGFRDNINPVLWRKLCSDRKDATEFDQMFVFSIKNCKFTMFLDSRLEAPQGQRSRLVSSSSFFSSPGTSMGSARES